MRNVTLNKCFSHNKKMKKIRQIATRLVKANYDG